MDWRSRGHFLALASTVMRRILVDHARARLTSKRGAGQECRAWKRSTTDTVDEGADSDENITAIDGALTRLAAVDDRQVQIVQMRYFGGLTIEETAQALDISEATVKREWTLARAWLKRELSRGPVTWLTIVGTASRKCLPRRWSAGSKRVSGASMSR